MSRRKYNFHKVKHKSEKGFIVWNPESLTPPKIKHSTQGAAIQAAKSLAVRYPGNDFHVCASFVSFHVPIEPTPT